MNNPSNLPELPLEPEPITSVRSLRELIDIVTGRTAAQAQPQEDSGLMLEPLPFPFMAIVGQSEMKLALLLTLINPAIGGTLLIGPRGTGKTTAARSLIDLLPDVERSSCFYGCLPEDLETEGMDAICPDCAQKVAQGLPLTYTDHVRLVELPLNSRLEDAIGGIDERAAANDRLRLKRGILAHADRNILYVDEVNLLADNIVDAILDAAAMGYYTVRRGAVSATYRSRFRLIGSMNPEEGNLRPQIMDRFGLRVIVQGLDQVEDRWEAYQRVMRHRENPRLYCEQFSEITELAKDEINSAIQMLPNVKLPDEVAQIGIRLIQALKIDSLRAEITLFEAARAYAAADSRLEITRDDLHSVAPMALRMRHSTFISSYIEEKSREEDEISTLLALLTEKITKDGNPPDDEDITLLEE
ncbi:protoporphyrin IX magnesium-chelatase [Longilinea arvoryzae]|uniref:Mg-protoporphyrin IX chelatase n=1 Tax=Longilinea arvoryzae TaxID=360412 RepID=A0A0S7BAH7_9CHLR|nr:ATP-binding protein [Longilinea arvoryzae]GAP14636.1 protoporphyrin IX magnesium-chelatase [Longilinea arvoryzae]